MTTDEYEARLESLIASVENITPHIVIGHMNAMADSLIMQHTMLHALFDAIIAGTGDKEGACVMLRKWKESQ